MIRKELALLKLGIICLQIVLMLLLLPSTQLITSQLLGGLVTNPLTLGILFLLHAYTYRECSRSRMPKTGHLLGVLAVAIQFSFPIYLLSTLVLGIESYLLLSNRLPSSIERLNRVKKVKHQ